MKLNKKGLKLFFLTTSVCLAGLSVSNLKVGAREDSIEERLFKRVEHAVEQGNLLSSKEDIKRVLKLNPRHPGATFYAGQLSFEKGNYETAYKFLKRVENDLKYGTRARKLLAEIRLYKYRKNFLETLNVALKGEAYSEALKICEEILSDDPNNPDILFLAAYAAAMYGNKDSAENYLARFNKTKSSSEEKAELKAFIDAIFSVGYAPEIALEKLMSLTDSRLMTEPVRRKIKDLIVSLKEIDKFEKFINLEKSRPNADINKLERELISFLIEQNQYEKAMELVNQRPTTQLEDNLLYVRLLILTKQEEKAMLSARYLLSSNPQDLRLYDIWVQAWLSYVDRNSKLPEGTDDTGKSFDEMADEVLNKLKFDKLVSMNPQLLLRLLRLAVLMEDEKKVTEIRSYAVKISFDDNLAEMLLKTVDSLIAINRASIAAELLESARNQLQDNYNLSVKLAEIYFINNNPESAAQILEHVLRERPEMIRAFMLWVDCLNFLGKGAEAEKAILRRLEEPDLHEIVRRQLENKLEVVRMQSLVMEQDKEQEIEESEPKDALSETEEKTEEP